MLEKIAKLGKKFYRDRLRNMLESQENGKFVAIEPVQEKYFVHKKAAFALQQGQTDTQNQVRPRQRRTATNSQHKLRLKPLNGESLP